MAFNSMQSNLGLPGSPGEVTPMNTPSPAQAAQMMSQQALEARAAAMQQLQTAAQFLGTTPSVGTSAQQMSNQMSVMQYMTPLVSPGGLAGFGGGGSMMPSPLLTGYQGGYQPQASQARYNPVPLMPPPPIINTPFTPQPPAMPLFTTAWEQELRNRESRADSLSALAAQIPGAIGQLGAYGGAAALGASFMGGRFGGIGRSVGAIGGAALAQFSGFAQGMGNLAGLPWQDQREALEMGGGIGRMSQNFVVAPGSQRNQFGPGLNRSSSIDLAGSIQGLAQSPAFQQSTGGMFNQMDLMNIMGQAGQAGLMDQSQNVSAIRRNLQMTAQTIREFMQLTNDPDVSNVIRTMATLHHQVGMNQTQMREAAANMRAYSRSAGMGLDAMQSTGGMMGAATFGQAGLLPGAGYNYGMYALASARQGVAAGAYTPSSLQALGGVQGIASREAQMQAAMFSMEPLGLALSQRGPGGYQFDPDTLQEMMQMPGSFGLNSMVRRARQQFRGSSANQLAMFPLQQQEIRDQLAQSVSPQQATLMRYRMAMDTGTEMGLTGGAAFVTGARRLFGDTEAQQMVRQGASSAFWVSQQQEVRMREYERRAQYWDRMNQGRVEDSDYLGFGAVINAGKDALAAGSRALAQTIHPGVTVGEYGFERAAITSYESAKRAISERASSSNWLTDTANALLASVGFGSDDRRHGTITHRRRAEAVPKSEADLNLLSRSGVRAMLNADPFTQNTKDINLPGNAAGEILGADITSQGMDKAERWFAGGLTALGIGAAPFSGGASLLLLGGATVAVAGGEFIKWQQGNNLESQYKAKDVLLKTQEYVRKYEDLQRLSEGTDVADRGPLESQVTKATRIASGDQQELIKGFSSHIKKTFGDNVSRLSAEELKKEFNVYVGSTTAVGGKQLSGQIQKILTQSSFTKDLIRLGFAGALADPESKASSNLRDRLTDMERTAEEGRRAIDIAQGTGEAGLRSALAQSQAKETTWSQIQHLYSNKNPLVAPQELTDAEFEQAKDFFTEHDPLQAGVMVALKQGGGKPLDALEQEYKKLHGGSIIGWGEYKRKATEVYKKDLTSTDRELIDKTTNAMAFYHLGTSWLGERTRENIQETFNEATGASLNLTIKDKGQRERVKSFKEFSDSVKSDQLQKLLAADEGSPARAIGNVLLSYRQGIHEYETNPRYKTSQENRRVWEERLGDVSYGKIVTGAGVGAGETVEQSAPGISGDKSSKVQADLTKAQQEFNALLKGLVDPTKGGFVLFKKAIDSFISYETTQGPMRLGGNS